MDKIIPILIFLLLVLFFIKVSWLILGFLLIVILAMVLMNIGSEKPASYVAKSEQKEIEVLHPVVYEDVGGPGMYPTTVKITHRKGALMHRGPIERIGFGVGVVFKSLIKGIRKGFGDED